MKALSVVSLALMLTAAMPVYAHDQDDTLPLHAGAGPFLVSNVAVIATSALIGGAVFFLLADLLFIETVSRPSTAASLLVRPLPALYPESHLGL